MQTFMQSFSFIPLQYDFWEEDLLMFFRKFNISVAMATNQNQQFGQNSYGL